MMSTHVNAAQRLHSAMSDVIVGNTTAINAMVIAAITGGHILIEGVPGTAKTLLARLFGALIDADVKRIQFTPDVTPTDVLGTMVYDPKDGSFTLRRGPIFTDILIADEINRTPPKTQSALLEVMEERAATIDGQRDPVSELFLVCATQNPIDFEGTYPLPEAQLDRFLVRVRTTYPPPDQELALLQRFALGFDGRDLAAAGVKSIMSRDEILAMRKTVREISCAPALQGYLHAVVLATRAHPEVALGASSRGLLALLRATQGMAYLRGRDFATPDNVKEIAAQVLSHRVLLRPEAELDGVTSEGVVEEILRQVPVPRDPA